MDDDCWLRLLKDFIERRIDVDTFHDRFFDEWHSQQRVEQEIPKPIEQLFYAVEAYCPDPTLRDPGSPFEADEAEVRRETEIAFDRLQTGKGSRKLT